MLLYVGWSTRVSPRERSIQSCGRLIERRRENSSTEKSLMRRLLAYIYIAIILCVFIVVVDVVVVVVGVVVFVAVMVVVVVVAVVVVVGLLCVASRLISNSPRFTSCLWVTKRKIFSPYRVHFMFVSFSLFQATILHHVVLFLLLQHNSWTFLCFYANSTGRAFRSDFHLAYRSNITDAGFPGLGQRYVARTQYKQFISGRGYVKWDIQHTDLLCCHVVHYFLKQLLTNELMFVRLLRRKEGRTETPQWQDPTNFPECSKR